jgi:class 3 adenylate cyclase
MRSTLLRDGQNSRFVGGGAAEAELLFGAPLPPLPPPERDGVAEVFFVNLPARLRAQSRKVLQGLLAQIGASGPPPAVGQDAAKEQTDYEQALAKILRSVRHADRGQGLVNLFWLALSRDIALSLREMEARTPSLRKAKLSLHPLLSSMYRRLEQEARRPANGETPLLGCENRSLIEAIIDDGFAFTELTAADLDVNAFLAGNKRYRIAPELFFEMQQILVRETERRLREGDRGLLFRAARHLPGLPRDQYLKPQSVLKVMMSMPILTYLLADAWSTGSKLMVSSIVKAEIERRKPAEIVDAFLDLLNGLKRFEIVCQARDRVELIGSMGRERDLEEKVRAGLRVYEFGESAQVMNNAVNATVLFLDLRGFTQTSEGNISERDLTRELYLVFDQFVPIVRRFGGKVDKYLGDGMMVTFGTERANPIDPLNALRTAVLCQESLRKQREQRRTYFLMGVAIHYGRVYVARFIEDEERVQSTVIGRNVNLAGRLSSAAKKPMMEEDDGDTLPVVAVPARSTGLRVSVDAEGTLFNEGIAISRDTLVQLEAHLALVHGEGLIEYEDEAIDRRLLIRYAGDAKFKGLRSSLPVYDVDHEPR